MNNTFLLWLGVAGAIGVGLLLLLDAPAPEPQIADMSDVRTLEQADYWEPVTPPAATYVALPATPAVACASCGTPRVSPTCSACGVRHVVSPTPPMVGGCGVDPVKPCSKDPCDLAPRTPKPPCGDPSCDPCHGIRPGINRNSDFCVDECGFLQLHTTIPRPLCGNVSYRWSASRGSFLDPTSGAPIYYAPNTYLSNGEDVVITLTIHAPDGTQVSDHVRVHVSNVR